MIEKIKKIIKHSQKTKISSKEIGKALFVFVKRFSKALYINLKPEIEKIGIKFDNDREITFSQETIIINLWIISKVLSPDKKVLDELHKIYLSIYTNLARNEKEKKLFARQAEKELYERYKEYYDAWNDKSRGNQTVLALTMLEHMINKGNLDKKLVKKLVNIMLTYRINMHILTVMRTILDFRKDFEIID